MLMKKTFDVFISYSHKDKNLKDKLETHLSNLKDQDLISSWHDNQIKAGKDWKKEIDEHLKCADIILLLVSPDFLASKSCKAELKEAMKRRESENINVIPIILHPCDWKNTKFAKLQAIPEAGKPVVLYTNQNKAFLNIIDELRSILTTNRNSLKKTQWNMVISGTIKEIHKPEVKAIAAHLRKLSKDSTLTLLRTELGSVILYLESTLTGFRKIRALFKDGSLEKNLNLNIESVELDPKMQETESEVKQSPFNGNHKEQEKILVISKSKTKVACNRVATSLKQFADSKNYNWSIKKKVTTYPLGEEILELAEENRFLIYIHGVTTKEDAVDCTIAVKLEKILQEKKCTIIQISFTGQPMPFGFPRGIYKIVSPQKNIIEDSVINELTDNIISHLKGDALPLLSVSRAIDKSLNNEALSRVKESVTQFIKLFENNMDILHTAVYLLDWVSFLCLKNKEEVWKPTLNHVRRVLTNLEQLCGPIIPFSTSENNIHTQNNDHYPLLSEEDYFCAMFGVLLHNQSLQRVVPDANWGKYVDNAKNFLNRTKSLKKNICLNVPEKPLLFIKKVFWLGIEMFRDSIYWGIGLKGDQESAKEHKEFSKSLDQNFKKISIALRICDISDIGHRTVPDLVRDLFMSAEYKDGYECYYKQNFIDNKDFLFASPPTLENKQLQLEWPKIQTSGYKDFIGKIREIIEGQVSKILESLKYEGEHPNLAVQLVPIKGQQELIEENLSHMLWSFFPLAIEYPPSDSIATRNTINILPKLVEYIYNNDVEEMNESEIREHVNKFLDIIKRLRRNSHFLPSIVEIVRKAIKNIPPEEFSGEIIKSLDKFSQQNLPTQWLLARQQSNNEISSTANCFFVYGNSMPATEWLIGLAMKCKKPIKIIFLYCLRKLIVPGSAFQKNLEILCIDEHNSAKDHLVKMMEEYKLPTNKIIIEKEIWEFEKLPEQQLEKNNAEVLFGARRFLVEGNETYAICNYGSDLLSVCSKFLEIPIRIVTAEDKFNNALLKYIKEDRSDVFSITYSKLDVTSEDERVPLNLISYITTEQQDYNSNEGTQKLREITKKDKITQKKQKSDNENNTKEKSMWSNKNDRQRLEELEEILRFEYKKMSKLQRDIAISSNADYKFELDEKIKSEILPRIRKYEIESAKLISEGIDFDSISTTDAKSIISDLYNAIYELESVNKQKLPKEVLDKLEELKKINNSRKDIGSELKLVVPIVPFLVYFEIEINADRLMYKVWQRVKALGKNNI